MRILFVYPVSHPGDAFLCKLLLGASRALSPRESGHGVLCTSHRSLSTIRSLWESLGIRVYLLELSARRLPGSFSERVTSVAGMGSCVPPTETSAPSEPVGEFGDSSLPACTLIVLSGQSFRSVLFFKKMFKSTSVLANIYKKN